MLSGWPDSGIELARKHCRGEPDTGVEEESTGEGRAGVDELAKKKEASASR